MILAGQLLLVDQPPRARIAPGYVVLKDDRIDQVVVGTIPDSYDAGGPTALISPGFIDTHLHLPQFDMIGGHGMPLLDWLDNLTFPAERKWADVDYASAMTRRVIDQCFDHGTTTIAAYASCHHQSTLAALKIASEMGMRGVIGQVLMDREVPKDLCGTTQQMVDEADATQQAFPPSQRMSAAVTPRSAISFTADLMAQLGELSVQRDAIVQTHLAEPERECELIEKLFDGTRYVDVYNNAGLLHRHTLLGHGIYLSESDRQTLVDTQAVVAHCPTANSFLRSGTMNRHQYLGENVRLSLGSDIGAGYERSMVRVGKAMIESAALIGDSFPSAAEAWYAITAGNAAAMGLVDAGRLQPGDPADVLLIQPDIPWLENTASPLSNLMFAWDDRWLTTTFVRGNCA